MAGGRIEIEPDPVVEVYKKDLDLTLIRENLKRSVDERFERLMALQRFAEELQRAERAAPDDRLRSSTPNLGRSWC